MAVGMDTATCFILHDNLKCGLHIPLKGGLAEVSLIIGIAGS